MKRSTKRKMRDLAERVLWTFVACAGTNVLGAGALNIEQWRAAVLAGGNGVGTLVLVVARQRLRVLPDPGRGLPGLPVEVL